jgi:transcription elongation factor GreA-like protein
MSKRIYLLSFLSAAFFLGVAAAQEHPLMNMIADRVIQKYQQASCEELWKKKGHHTDEEKNLMQLLRDDPQMRKAFIDKVAAPIANKMFECGMLP